jgi:hypothetical protein
MPLPSLKPAPTLESIRQLRTEIKVSAAGRDARVKLAVLRAQIAKRKCRCR